MYKYIALFIGSIGLSLIYQVVINSNLPIINNHIIIELDWSMLLIVLLVISNLIAWILHS